MNKRLGRILGVLVLSATVFLVLIPTGSAWFLTMDPISGQGFPPFLDQCDFECINVVNNFDHWGINNRLTGGAPHDWEVVDQAGQIAVWCTLVEMHLNIDYISWISSNNIQMVEMVTRIELWSTYMGELYALEDSASTTIHLDFGQQQADWVGGLYVNVNGNVWEYRVHVVSYWQVFDPSVNHWIQYDSWSDTGYYFTSP